jgi:predicted transcriptional regulator
MENTLETISKKLSILIALTVRSLPEGIDTKESIRLLDSYGLSNGEVASILGMKPNAVSMARIRMNGGKDGKPKEK